MFTKEKTTQNWRICIIVAVFAVSLGAWSPAQAQEQSGHENRTVAIDRIERAIRGGDMRSLLSDASGKVIVRLFDDEKLYSQSQARYVLEEFFEGNPARAFRFLDISPPERSQFAVGTMLGEEDRLLEIYVRLRQNGPEWVLREIRIRPASEASDTSND